MVFCRQRHMINLKYCANGGEVQKMNLYEKYYLTKENVIEILKNDGIIVFDTSALLDLYYYSEDSRDRIFENVFPYFANRLWIPAQVYFEFLKNKDTVAAKPRKTYEALLDINNKDMGYVPKINFIVAKFEKTLKELEGVLTTLEQTTAKEDKHPFLEQEIFTPMNDAVNIFRNQMREFSTKVDTFQTEIQLNINKKIDELSLEDDAVQKQIEKNFVIGNELSYEQMTKISIDGKRRYSEKIPPGYMDQENKIGLQKYGDLFVWAEILNYAAKQKKDVILITNDVKEDWVDKKLDCKPRFELLKEFNSITHKNFWMCNMKDFLHLVNQINDEKSQIPENVMEDVEEVSNQSIENTEQDILIQQIVSDWMEAEQAVIIDKRLPLNLDWRIYGNNRVYNAIDYRGDEWIVLANFPTKYNYASVLHSLTNLREIKRDYDRLGKKYHYSQLIILKNKENADKFMQVIRKTPKLNKVFEADSVENTVVYMMKGMLFFVDANHAMG